MNVKENSTPSPEQFNLSLEDKISDAIYKIPSKEIRSPKGIKSQLDPSMISNMLRKNSYDKLNQYSKDFINSPDSPNYFPKKSNSSNAMNFDNSPPRSSNFINIDGYGFTRSACTSPTMKSSIAQQQELLSRSEMKKTNSFNEESNNELFENRAKRAISFSTKTSLAFEFSQSQSLAQMKLNLIRIQVRKKEKKKKVFLKKKKKKPRKLMM